MSYSPSTNLLEGIRNLFPLELCPWDDYFLRMAQTDFLSSRHTLKGSKTFFIRKAPFKGSYAIMGGLTAFLRTLADYEFSDLVSTALLDMGYKKEFINYLQNEHKKVDVTAYAVPEGSVFFPSEPAIVIEGSLLDLRMAEGMLLKNVNFPCLAMTKWSRVVQAASPGAAMEYARRRAQDDLRTTLYAYLAGVAVTSNAEIRRGIDVPVKGTMGHEYIQGYGDEFEAFDRWLEYNPDRPVLLVDTIETLKSGIPNAIKAFKKHKESIINAKGVPGIRNDSGDLAYLTIEERRLFDAAEMPEVVIYQTNDLDEYSIEAIREQIYTHAPRAGLDYKRTLQQIIWACGTQPGTCSDQPSLGGVAKLTSIEYQCNPIKKEEKPVLKIAKDNPIKTSIPGCNRSALVRDKDTGDLICCLIYQKGEALDNNMTAAYNPDDESKKIILSRYSNLEFMPRQKCVFQNGCISGDSLEVGDIRKRVKDELSLLHWTHKRFESPHILKVSLSRNLFELRKRMILNNQLMDR